MILGGGWAGRSGLSLFSRSLSSAVTSSRERLYGLAVSPWRRGRGSGQGRRVRVPRQQLDMDAQSSLLSMARPLAVHSQKFGPDRSSCRSRHNDSASQHAPHCRDRLCRSSDRLTRMIDASASSPSQRSSGNSDNVRGRVSPSPKTGRPAKRRPRQIVEDASVERNAEDRAGTVILNLICMAQSLQAL